MMTISSKSRKLPILALLAVSIAVIFGIVYTRQTITRAADVSKFDPGNIMSDAVMSNKNTMNMQQIQAFLDSKNRCNNTNTHMAAWYPHLQYTIRDGKFVCMAQDTFGGKSAAQIIWQVAQDYSINPQFLIVLLEKEQGLVSDTWPNHVQYRTATGFGCPDTAPCDSQYFGLENQLRQAANLFRNVLNGGWSNYPVGYTYVQYNPNAACGGSVVHIQNRATSALYRYTPYQPNQSALNAGYGAGDSCGAYGNRNTWMLFTDWFGSTQGSSFVSLEDPRWMKISKTTQKVHAYTGQRFGPTIVAGSQAKFVDKVFINNRWIARTHWDYINGNLTGFPADEIGEIDFESIPATTLVLNKDTKKYDPLRDKKLEQSSEASLFKAVDKVTIDNKTYYRTEWERSNGKSGSFSESNVDNFRMFNFKQPRYMVTKKSTPKIDILSNSTVEVIPENNTLFFNRLIRLNGVTYAQAKTDNGTNYVVSANDLGEMSTTNPYYSFVEPRMMRLSSNTTKFDIFTGIVTGPTLTAGTDAMFVDQIRINNLWYARTQWDHSNNNLHGILVDRLTEITPTAIAPKQLTVTKNTKKIDPIRIEKYEDISKGSKALFVDKITVLGEDYYRTQWEADQGRLRFIPAKDLGI